MEKFEKGSSHPQWLVKYKEKLILINTKQGVEIYLRDTEAPSTAKVFNINIIGTYKAKRLNAPISLIRDE